MNQCKTIEGCFSRHGRRGTIAVMGLFCSIKIPRCLRRGYLFLFKSFFVVSLIFTLLAALIPCPASGKVNEFKDIISEERCAETSNYPFTAKGVDAKFFYLIHEKKINNNNLNLLNHFQKGIYHFMKNEFIQADANLDKSKTKASYVNYLRVLTRVEREDYAGALKILQEELPKTKEPYLKSDMYFLQGILYEEQKNLAEAETAYKKSYKTLRYQKALYRRADLTLDRFLLNGDKKDWNNAAKMYRAVNTRLLMEEKSLYNEAYYYIVKVNSEYYAIYKHLTEKNILDYLKNKSFEDQINIIDALWKYNIKYVNYKEARDLQTILQTREGDCTDYVVFVKSLAEALGYKHRTRWRPYLNYGAHENIVVKMFGTKVAAIMDVEKLVKFIESNSSRASDAAGQESGDDKNYFTFDDENSGHEEDTTTAVLVGLLSSLGEIWGNISGFLDSIADGLRAGGRKIKQLWNDNETIRQIQEFKAKIKEKGGSFIFSK